MDLPKNFQEVFGSENNGKIKQINRYVRITLDKLQGIKADLVAMDNGQQEWKLPQLVEALKHWT